MTRTNVARMAVAMSLILAAPLVGRAEARTSAPRRAERAVHARVAHRLGVPGWTVYTYCHRARRGGTRFGCTWHVTDPELRWGACSGRAHASWRGHWDIRLYGMWGC